VRFQGCWAHKPPETARSRECDYSVAHAQPCATTILSHSEPTAALSGVRRVLSLRSADESRNEWGGAYGLLYARRREEATEANDADGLGALNFSGWTRKVSRHGRGRMGVFDRLEGEEGIF